MRTFVTAVFTAKDGKEEEVETIFRSLVAPSHGDEGCVSYALNRGQDDPRRFVFMEEWTSREALEDHLAQPHIAEGFEKLDGLLDSQEVIKLERIAGGDVDGR